MPILNIFKNVLDRMGSDSAPKSMSRDERRYYNRYSINAPDLIQFKHPERGIFKVINLSYKGALLEAVAGASLSDLTLPSGFELSAFGTSRAFKVFKADMRDGRWVLQFEHSEEGSIQNIGNFVEAIRCGSSAVSMPVDKSKITNPEQIRVRFFGDGPFDILIDKTKDGDIVFIMATIRRGSTYGSLRWSDGHIHTMKNIDHQGVAARMGQTHDIDRELVWICSLACLGLNFPEGPVCAALLGKSLTSQQSSESGVKNP